MTGTHSFLTLGAMAILAFISLRFNTTLLENRTTEIENKVYLTAFSLADDLIEEIKQKAFDEQTVVFRSITPGELTSSVNFAPEVRDAGESEFTSTWDDIDDYNGYTKQVSTPHVENYTVSSTVDYVSASNQDQVSNVQTFFKRVNVVVTSPYLSHEVRLSFVFTLHSK
jgi:hypothetical protein